jgi:hypothetical protein
MPGPVVGDGGTWAPTDRVYIQPEPALEFQYGQLAVSPAVGLTLFGPYDAGQFARPRGLVLAAAGTTQGLARLQLFLDQMQRPIISSPFDPDAPLSKEPYLWPVFPGFSAAFLCELPSEPSWQYTVDAARLQAAAETPDQYQRAHDAASLYLEALRIASERDEAYDGMICVIPDDVWKNCRPLSRVPGDRDAHVSTRERATRRIALGMFDTHPPDRYDYSVDFRRQLKARGMAYNIPIQIIRESTLLPRDTTPDDPRQMTKLSDRAWNLGTALYYKAGGRPWRVAGARSGVCYVGLAFRRKESDPDPRSACCAAQMFLKSGEGVVFRGEFGPWYSPSNKQFHLAPDAAAGLLNGVIQAYREQGGENLEEIFLHARSDISREEFEGYRRGCPPGVRLVGVRVQPARDELRLYRPGKWVLLRGTTWVRGSRSAHLWGSGFKPSILSYDGAEAPRPLRIDVQHGEADIAQVAADILALTKLNYNTSRLGDAEPVTVRFSDAVGEILIANPTITVRRPQFKFYI